MDLLNLWLLSGLIAHKAVWELLKSKQPASPAVRRAAQPLKTTVVKAVKISILAGLAVQTMLPPVFPIAASPELLRSVGASVYTAGLLIAVVGRLHLGDNWLDIEEAGTRRDQVVVSRGIYSLIRHPIYTGDLMLLLGLELALRSWLVAAVLVLAPVILFQAIREEDFLRDTLPGYDDYCRRTKRFVPFVA